MVSGMVADGRRGYMPAPLSWGGDTWGREIGDRCEVYDWALEGGVKAGVPVEGEWAVAAIPGAVVVAVTWLGGSWLGGEWVAR